MVLTFWLACNLCSSLCLLQDSKIPCLKLSLISLSISWTHSLFASLNYSVSSPALNPFLNLSPVSYYITSWITLQHCFKSTWQELSSFLKTLLQFGNMKRWTGKKKKTVKRHATAKDKNMSPHFWKLNYNQNISLHKYQLNDFLVNNLQVCGLIQEKNFWERLFLQCFWNKQTKITYNYKKTKQTNKQKNSSYGMIKKT